MENTVFVTGASGYIGSQTARLLRQEGYRVIGVDRVRRDNTDTCVDEFIHADYNSAESYAMLVDEEPGTIIHCAGLTQVGASMADPAAYYMENVAKTAAFLDQVRWLSSDPVVVFSSSAAVYGNPIATPISEDAPFNPMSPYGQTKAMTEIMLADFDRAYGLRSVSLRYFNAAGADTDQHDLGQAPGASHIIARLLEAYKDNKAFTLNGRGYDTPDGTCIRDYVHVQDIATAHLLATRYLLAGGASTQLNLGAGTGTSNGDIIQAVHRLVGPVEIAEGPRRPGDPDRLIADATRASMVLGWQPQHSDIDTIISSAWAWYNKQP